jgi:hypothetical protein
MALQASPWLMSQKDIDAVLSTPMQSITQQYFNAMVEAERAYLDEGLRRALGLWVSELEPEFMYRAGSTRPFGLTAKGHGTPYIEIKWDDNFYLTGDSIRYPISRRQS